MAVTKRKQSFWYSVVEDGPDAERYEHKGNWFIPRPREARMAAEEAAEDYWQNHDGWESTWPLTFALYETEDGPELHRFRVEEESEPVFSAYSLPEGGSRG